MPITICPKCWTFWDSSITKVCKECGEKLPEEEYGSEDSDEGTYKEARETTKTD